MPHAAAHILTGTGRYINTLQELHGPPIVFQAQFKVLVITCEALLASAAGIPKGLHYATGSSFKSRRGQS